MRWEDSEKGGDGFGRVLTVFDGFPPRSFLDNPDVWSRMAKQVLIAFTTRGVAFDCSIYESNLDLHERGNP